MNEQTAGPVSTSRLLRVYLIAVGVGGAALLVQSAFAAAHTPPPFGWLAITALTILAGCFRLRFASVSANIAIDDTFFISTALLFGPEPGTLTIAASAFVFSWLRRKPLRQLVFNPTGHAISMGVASRVFFTTAHVQPLAIGHAPIAPLVVPLIALTIVYFALTPV
jgi:hypothetical protein